MASAVGGEVVEYYGIPGAWHIPNIDAQVVWNDNPDWGEIGFQIADTSGNELYTGRDLTEALDAVKKAL